MPKAIKEPDRSIGVEIGADVDEVAPRVGSLADRIAGAAGWVRYSSRVRTLFRP